MLKALELVDYSLTANRSVFRAKNLFTTAKPVWTAVCSCALIALNLVLLMNYLAAVNSQSLQGYEIKQLQNRLSLLQEQNRKVNLKISEVTSMVSIQNDFLQANYVPAGTGRFLQPSQYTQR